MLLTIRDVINPLTKCTSLLWWHPTPDSSSSFSSLRATTRSTRRQRQHPFLLVWHREYHNRTQTKSLQWLVCIRECEYAVKVGKAAYLEQGENAPSLPHNLVKDNTLLEMVSHGKTMLPSIKETTVEPDDLGHKFLAPSYQRQSHQGRGGGLS